KALSPSGATTACQGSPLVPASRETSTSALLATVGVPSAAKVRLRTLTVPTSRLTTTATRSSGESEMAEPRLGPGKTTPGLVAALPQPAVAAAKHKRRLVRRMRGLLFKVPACSATEAPATGGRA